MRIILFLLAIQILFAQNNDLILEKLNNLERKIDKIEQNQKLIKQEMKLRFEAIDKRFEAIDKRFEDMNKRFEILTNFLLALTAGIFGLIGFMMWDRRTVISKAKEECINEIDNKKADKEYVEKLVKAMNELLVKNDEIAKEIFKKYGLL